MEVKSSGGLSCPRCGGPVAVGSQAFSSPFVFPSGRACRNFNELALACQEEWDSAKEMLQQGFLGTFLGEPGSVLSPKGLEGQAEIPSVSTGPPFHFPLSSLVYFQFVFAGITPLLMLGSILGRVSFKAWIPFVLLWITCVYTVNAFLIWGGGYFAAHGALDYSGGYVIHLTAGISGFIAAAVIGPRLQRDREFTGLRVLA